MVRRYDIKELTYSFGINISNILIEKIFSSFTSPLVGEVGAKRRVRGILVVSDWSLEIRKIPLFLITNLQLLITRPFGANPSPALSGRPLPQGERFFLKKFCSRNLNKINKTAFLRNGLFALDCFPLRKLAVATTRLMIREKTKFQ